MGAFWEDIGESFKHDMTVTGLEIKSNMEAFGEQFGVSLDGFYVALTEKDKTFKSLKETFGETAEQVTNILALVDAGIITLNESVVIALRNWKEQYDILKDSINEFYKELRQDAIDNTTRTIQKLTGAFTFFDEAAESVRQTIEADKQAFIEAGWQNTQWFDKQSARAVSLTMQDYWKDILDTEGLSDFRKQYRILWQEYQAYLRTLEKEGLLIEQGTQAAEAFAIKIKELRDSFTKGFIDDATSIIATDGMSALEKSIYLINKQYQEQIDIMKDAGSSVKEIALVEQAWQISIRNAQEEAYQSIYDFYKELKVKLDDLIWDFKGGKYATVQSEEGMAERYAQLYADALSTGDIDRFTNFVTGEFLEFSKGFGNYNEINARIISDLESLSAKLVDEASIGDLTGLLEQSNLSLSEIVRQTTLLTEAITKTNGFAAGGYHSGGLRIVGERGPELERTGQSRIFNNADLTSTLASLSKQGNVTVIIRMGTKEFKDFTAETIETHPETQRQIRRVAKAG